MHIQAIDEVLNRQRAKLEIFKEMRKALDVQPEDSAVFCFKMITNGEAGVRRVLG